MVTLKGSSSRAQGAALGTDADYEMSPVRAAQAVPPFRAYILNLMPFQAVPGLRRKESHAGGNYTGDQHANGAVRAHLPGATADRP
jgi:hypothetical protein